MSTLVVMAAGIGSRYGGGIKQLEAVGQSGEIIMDYSIYDALEAGFTKVVFIIRKDLEKDFKEIIGNRISKYMEVEYAFQELNDLPEGFVKPEERTKPWGTGQAILSCLGKINEPFAVINADDYYGKEAFVKVNEFLSRNKPSDEMFNFCMAGFLLGNTLSDNGVVTRGVCKVSKDRILLGVEETHGIEKTVNGPVVKDDSGNEIKLDPNSSVSMNMWGFTPDFIDELQKRFIEFLKVKGQDLKAEFLVPIIVDDLIKEKKAEVTVLETKDIWFGVTYKEDKEVVVNSLKKLVEQGVYPVKLFK